jgi:hypothetical protein
MLGSSLNVMCVGGYMITRRCNVTYSAQGFSGNVSSSVMDYDEVEW